MNIIKYNLIIEVLEVGRGEDLYGGALVNNHHIKAFHIQLQYNNIIWNY